MTTRSSEFEAESFMRPSLPSLLIAAAFTCVVLATGCGLKDDLYLPESPTEDEQTPDEEENESNSRNESNQDNQAERFHRA